MKRILLFILAFMIAVPAGGAFAAERDEITHAKTSVQFANLCKTDMAHSFKIDKNKGCKNFEKKFGADFVKGNKSKIKKAVRENGLYAIDDELNVTPVYATKKLVVDKPLRTLEGASEGVEYEGRTVLIYDTQKDAQEGYEALTEKYGEDNVFIDVPVKTDAWGSTYMGIDTQMQLYKAAPYGNAMKVAVLDTGIDANHLIFSGKKILPQVNVCGEDGDVNGHGTAVAGIIAESTPVKMQILPVKVLDNRGEGSMEDICNGVDMALESGAKVLNLSLSVELANIADTVPGFNVSEYLEYLESRFANTKNYGAVAICSAGNEAGNIESLMTYPAMSKYAISVGAINSRGEKCSFSNTGTSLDFCAPGKNLDVAVAGSTNYAPREGTSFAAPYISACSAWLYLEGGQTGMTSVYNRLKLMIDENGDLGPSGYDTSYGWGCPNFNTPKIDLEESGGYIDLAYWTKTYTGSRLKPKVTIKGLKGLVEGTDFVVTYEQNLHAGLATVVVLGKGAYSGTLYEWFEILPKKLDISMKVDKTSFTYNGKVQKPQASSVTSGTRTFTPSQYSVKAPSSKNAGKYTCKVSLKGDYSGMASVSYTIKKAVQKLTITNNTKKVKYSTKSKVVKPLTVKGAKGKLTYSKVRGSLKLSINKTTGKVKVKAKTKKGTYKMRVKIKSNYTTNYKTKIVYRTVKVKVY